MSDKQDQPKKVICTLEARYCFSRDNKPLVELRGLPADADKTPEAWLAIAAQLTLINQHYAPEQHDMLRCARRTASRWHSYEVFA